MPTKVIQATVRFNGVAEAEDSIAALRKQIRELRKEQSKLSTSDPRFNELQKEIGQTTAELNQLNKAQKEVTKSFEAQQAVPGSYNALQAETKQLTAQFKGLKVGVNATQREYDELKAKIRENNLELAKMNRELRGSQRISESFRQALVGSFKQIAVSIASGVSALAAFNELRKVAGLGFDLERGFAQVNTVAQLSTEKLEQLKDEVLDVARTSTANLDEVPTALFNIVSATGDVEASQVILEKSLRASKAGFSDLTSTADAGVGIFNAVKSQVTGIDEVFDVLFRTQKEGVLTFQDLSNVIPKIIPSANAAGISFKETAGALAAITKAGVDADQASTFLDRTLTALADPAKKANFDALGVAVFDAEGNTRDFISIFSDLAKSIDDLNPEEKAAALSGLGLDARAAKGVGILVENIEVLDQVAGSVVEGSLGELDRQFAASANTTDDLKIAFNDVKVQLIQGLQPAFEAIARGALGFIQALFQIGRFLSENRELIVLAAGAYAVYNRQLLASTVLTARDTVIKTANNVAFRLQYGWLVITQAAQKAYSVAVGIASGAISLNTVRTYASVVAQRALAAAQAATPWGLVTLAIVGATAALVAYSRRAKELTEEQKLQAELSAQVAKAYSKEVVSLTKISAVLKSTTATTEQRNQAIKDLNDQYGDYLPNLVTEKDSTEAIEQALKLANDQLLRKVRLQVQEQKINEIVQRQAETQQLALAAIGDQADLTSDQVISAGDEFGRAFGDKSTEEINRFFQNFVTGAGQTDEFRERVSKLSPTTQQVIDKIARLGEEGLVNFGILAGSSAKFQSQLESINRIFEKDQLGGAIGGTFSSGGKAADNAAQSIKALEEAISQAQERQKLSTTAAQYREIQKEIDAYRKKIEAITGPTAKASKKIEDNARKTREQLAKDLEANEDVLNKLRKQFADAAIDQIDDETDQRLAAEKERYSRQIQGIIDQSAEVITRENATKEQVADAIDLQNRLIETAELEHYGRLNEIQGDALKKELEQQRKTSEAQIKQSERELKLQVDVIEREIELTEGNYAKRLELIRKLTQAKLNALALDTSIALREAKTEEERVLVAEQAALKRLEILKEESDQMEEEEERRGGLISRLLGLTPEQASILQSQFASLTQSLNTLIDQYFERRKAAINDSIDFTENRINEAQAKIEAQLARTQSLEEQLAQATGARRQRLIDQIEQERLQEQRLLKEKQDAEKQKAQLIEQAAKLERKQAAIRKAQALAQAIINTASAVTGALAAPPFPPLNTPFVVATGILGAAQVATIAATKFQDGGEINGPSHDQGGVAAVAPGSGPIELEGNEYIIKAAATRRNYQAAEMLNREGDRMDFDLVPRMPAYFADGGAISSNPDFGMINDAVTANQREQLAFLSAIAGNTGISAKKSPVLDVVEFTRQQERVSAQSEEAVVR